MNITLPTLIIISLLFSCTNNSTENTLLSGTTKNITNKIQPTSFPIDSIGQPNNILSFGDVIILSEELNQKSITVFNDKTKKISRLLPKGRAANEVINVHILAQNSSRDNEFYVFDDSKQKMFNFSQNNEGFDLIEMKDINGYSTFSVDDTVVVGNLKGSDARFGISTIEDVITSKFGDYSQFDLTCEIGNAILPGMTTINRAQKKFASFSFFTPSFSIVSYLNKGELIYNKTYKMPEFNTNKGEKASFPTFKMTSTLGFVSLTSCDKYIYALYSGETFKDAMSSGANALLANVICVFDWDGDFITNLESDIKIRSIAFNEQQQKLFGVFLSESGHYEVSYINITDIQD